MFYKVLKRFEGRLYSPIASVEWMLEYPVGLWIAGKHNSKIFIFDAHSRACDFKRREGMDDTYEVWECEADSPSPVYRIPIFIDSFMRYWNNPRAKGIETMATFEGTFLAKAVKLCIR
jgi:hypothetical protein